VSVPVAAARRVEVQRRVGMLTPREVEVFARVVTGMPNKQIGAVLGIGEKTVKVHPRPGHGEDAGRIGRRAGPAGRRGRRERPRELVGPRADSATVTADALVLVWVSETAMALRQYRASSCWALGLHTIRGAP
jgi:DNA-binding CsgD family transcriptional regulator